MKLWTRKFILALGVLAVFIADAKWYPLDDLGHTRHLLPFMDTWAASFVCLLAVLYIVTHSGSWVLARFRGRSADEEDNAARKRES